MPSEYIKKIRTTNGDIPLRDEETNSELVDVRVGADGTTYESAGEAVRFQITSVIDEMKKYSDNNREYISTSEQSPEVTFSGDANTSNMYGIYTSQNITNANKISIEVDQGKYSSPIIFYLCKKEGDKIFKCKKKYKGYSVTFDLTEYSKHDTYIIFVKGGLKYETISNDPPYGLYEYAGDVDVNSTFSTTFTSVSIVFDVKISYVNNVNDLVNDYQELIGRFPIIDNKTVIVVAKDGSGDFLTINEALRYADKYMSRETEVTVIVYPGTYKETVNVNGNRFFSIVGVNRETCIIRDDSGQYNKCPLRIEGNSYVSNLTLISTHKDDPNFVKDGIIQQLPSYGLHIDARHKDNDDDYVCTIENCKIYSEQNPAVGIGLDKNQTVNLINCEIITHRTEDVLNATGVAEGSEWAWKPDGGALFYHALYPGNYTDDEGYQRLVVKNCIIENNDDNVVSGEAGGMENQVTLVFIGNSGWSSTNGASFVKGLTNATLSPLSHGNNMIGMNYQNE